MKVLSLYDGMACGMLAMQKAGFEVDRYVAYEIDKYAVQTSSHNFPMIEHRGDVFLADFTEFLGFDAVIGGSPCTYWSIAQKNNRETEASGMGWELFCQYVRAVHEVKPRFFVYENNKSMSQAIRASIDEAFGFEAICINSAQVSAQNRQRLYWVGVRNADGTYSKAAIDQPDDRGILLRHILESSVTEPGYEFASIGVGYRNRREDDGCLYRRFETSGKEKANALTTVQTDSMVAEPVRLGDIGSTAQAHRVYSCDGKSVTINAGGGGQGGKTGLYLVPYDVEELSEEYYHGNGDGNILGKIVCKNTSNNNGQPAQGTRVYKTDGKSICLDADSRKYVITGTDATGWCRGSNGKTVPVYEVRNGFITIKERLYPIKLLDGFYIIRKLTVRECMRLQTVPEWYEFPVSNAQAYKMLGNGWTVDVIAHILRSVTARGGEDDED